MDTTTLPRDHIIDLCQRLIRTPSVNGEHPERAVAELAAAFASDSGLDAEIVALDPERPNLLVRAGPRRPADLLLVAHLDTVPAGDPAGWSFAPFGGELSDGRIYGRGACDTKGGLTAALAALLLIQRMPEAERPAVLLAGVPDEESGATGRLGVSHLHQLGMLSGRGAIYCYPGSEELVVGHRGVLRLAIETGGSPQHTGGIGWQDAPAGLNAVTTMSAILAALEALRFEDAGAGLFAPLRTVITPTTIAGGSGVSMVPGRCVASVDIRLVPAAPRETVLAKVRQTIEEVAARRGAPQPALRETVSLPPTEIAGDAAVVRAVRQAARELLGREPRLAISGPANESYLLNAMGIPTCIIGPTGDNAHAADEYVVADTIFDAAAVYARVAQLLRQPADV
jgi:acetylornithine deacetylase/succinyl-diaminopimelate desuccinylase-like protein